MSQRVYPNAFPWRSRWNL